jgi:hypothetical protein
MSQRVKDILRDFIIADQWTEPHSPWQNPDKTGAPDNLWFLAQDFSTCL